MNKNNLITEDKTSLIDAINESSYTGNGENLIRKSKKQVLFFANTDNPNGNMVLTNGKIQATIGKGNAWMRPNSYTQVVGITEIFKNCHNKMYSFSMDIKTPVGQTAGIDIGFSFRKAAAGDKFFSRSVKAIENTNGEWRRVTISGIVLDPNKEMPDSIVIGVTIAEAGIIEYKNMKLEEGTPTAWTPCKDDFVNTTGTQQISAPEYHLGDEAKIVFNKEKGTIDFVIE